MTLKVIHGGAGGFEGGQWRKEIRTSKDGGVVKSHENVRIILSLHPEWAGKIRRDEFSGRIMVSDCPFGDKSYRQWQDDDDIQLVAWLDRLVFKDFGSTMVAIGVRIVACENAFHPVRNYLSGLEWDGVERVDHFFIDCFGVADTPVARGIARRWLVSGIARIMKPGCKADCLVVLEGEQGAGKSKGLRHLFGDDWYSDSEINLGHADAYAALRGKWGVELAEFGAFSKQEQSQLKRYISSPVDSYRASYGRHFADVPRQSIFCASTNDENWNHDATGARRYWPMRVGLCKPSLVAEIRDQIWAEALTLYRAGEKWWVDTEEFKELMRKEQDERYEAHPWEDIVRTYVETRNLDRVSVQEIYSHVGIETSKQTIGDSRLINAILVRLGYRWETKYRTPDGRQVRGRSKYTVPK